MNKLVDWVNRKVFRRYRWTLETPTGSKMHLRADCLSPEQFSVQREQAAARIRSMHENS